MDKKKLRTGLGATPPDLTVIVARAAPITCDGYMRGFYCDESRPTGLEQPGVRQGWHAAHPVEWQERAASETVRTRKATKSTSSCWSSRVR